jgi:hypothetical protein
MLSFSVCLLLSGSKKVFFFVSDAGMPDGLFPYQKSQFGYISEGLRLEFLDVRYGHLEYFTDIWDIL